MPPGEAPVIQADEAWRAIVTREWAFGGSVGDVDVCVVDSGVDPDHPLVGPLASALAVAREGEEVSIVEDELGDVCGHGTACAGIVRSLAPGARLHSVRVLGAGATGAADLILAGLRHAIESGHRVISLSLSTTKRRFAEDLHELADLAYFNRTILVASAHNLPVDSYPWRRNASLHREQLRGAAHRGRRRARPRKASRADAVPAEERAPPDRDEHRSAAMSHVGAGQ
jgi:subtilisin family serine protease